MCNADEAQALSMKRMLAKAGPVVELENGMSYRDVSDRSETARDVATLTCTFPG